MYEILDEGMLCHLAFSQEDHPFCVPTAYARDEDSLIVHGAPASRLMRAGGRGFPVCATVSLFDGLVLARSTFHHSVNFRSVMIFGTLEPIRDLSERDRALNLLVEHLIPGRVKELRESSEQELKETAVMRLPLNEASIKIRSGEPVDAPEDVDPSVWAGVLPFETSTSMPRASQDTDAGVEAPDSVKVWGRRQRRV